MKNLLFQLWWEKLLLHSRRTANVDGHSAFFAGDKSVISTKAGAESNFVEVVVHTQ
jgi:hypothetical protein